MVIPNHSFRPGFSVISAKMTLCIEAALSDEKIPLGPFAHCGDRDLLWSMVQRTIEDLFFNKIGISRE